MVTQKFVDQLMSKHAITVGDLAWTFECVTNTATEEKTGRIAPCLATLQNTFKEYNKFWHMGASATAQNTKIQIAADFLASLAHYGVSAGMI